MFYAYYLESIKYRKYYVGFTADLKERFVLHNEGKGSVYTAKYKPWRLIFYEAHKNEKDAREMERFYKTGYGREVLKKKLKNYLEENSKIV